MEDLIALRETHGHCLDEGRSRRASVLIEVLVDTGYWPATNKTGQYTAKKMWEGYGERWNEYDGPLSCPHCNTDLRNMESGPPFKREIGIIANDRVKNWRCPDCGKDF